MRHVASGRSIEVSPTYRDGNCQKARVKATGSARSLLIGILCSPQGYAGTIAKCACAQSDLFHRECTACRASSRTPRPSSFTSAGRGDQHVVTDNHPQSAYHQSTKALTSSA